MNLIDYQCLINQQVADKVKCWNQEGICITDNQDKCINYYSETDPSSDYIGLLKNTNVNLCQYKCAQLGFSAKLSDIVILKIPYCLDITSSFIISLISSYKYAGIQNQDYKCLEKNQTSSNGVSYCKQGYCIFENKCTPLSKYLPSKLDNFDCAQINSYKSIECYQDQPFTNQSYCLDTYNNVCIQIQDFSQNSIGILRNGTCVQKDKFYDNIFLCSDQSCIFEGKTGFACHPFDDIYIGVDSEGYCLKRYESYAVRCKKIKFCIEQNTHSCVDLSKNYPDRIGKEKNTTNCLGQNDKQGQNIEICANGYCLHSISDKQNSDYCIPYGGFFQPSGPFIGVESITERCLLVDQHANSISLCYGLDYCLFFDNAQQVCKKLYYPFSYDYVDSQLYSFAAKNANGNCQSINKFNSISCAAPQLCLQVDQCISLNDQNSNSLFIGRDIITQKCFNDESFSAQYCKLNYCLFQNQCIQLDLEYIGREYLSSKCLLNNQSTNNKVKQCLDEYCISQVIPQQYSCIKIDYRQSKNAIGYNSDKECLAANQPVAVKCFKGMACLQGETCQYVDASSTYKCSLNDQTCSQSLDNCSACSFYYCLSPINQKICVPLETNCQDLNGVCAQPSSGQCNVCPLNTCLDINKRNCISFSYMKMKENECINYQGPEIPCGFLDMNIYTDDTNLLCADEQNLCVLQKEANSSFKCLRCSNNFINLGDNRCLSFQERDNTQKQDKDTIFSLNVIYVEEDMCQGKICNEQNLKKCPKGCYSCNDLNFCTKCIEGYFLFKDLDQSFQCVSCNYAYYSLSSYPETYRIPLGTIQTSQKCLDCSLETGIWKINQLATKICQQVVLKFSIDQSQSLKLVENQPSVAFSYTVNIDTSLDIYKYPKYYLTASNLCTQKLCTFCQYQLKNDTYTQVCLNCQLGYYLDQKGDCQSCKSGCEQCKLGFLSEQGVKQYYYEVSEELRKSLNTKDLIPICLVCSPQYIYSYDLTSCDSCGSQCASCQYANKNSYFNIGQTNNVQLTQNQYKTLGIFKQCNVCLQSSDVIQANGINCGPMIQECAVHSLMNKATGLVNLIYDLSYYEGGSTINYSLICLACKNQFILSNDKQSCQQNFNIKDINCLQFDTDNISCKLCKKYALDLTNKVCNVKFKCSQAVSGCDKCLYQNYLDELSLKIKLFTCLQCQQSNYMTTLLGCFQCLDGCSSCYEMGYDSQQKRFNLTAHILYENFQYDIDTRLNYKTILKVQTFCSSCLDGYYFDPIQKICIKFPCGQLCNKCIFQLNRFICIDCNQTAILQSIQSIQLFIGNFFYGQNYISQQLQISTFTGDQKSCQACPFLCETCEQANNLFRSDYSIYQTQCFSCKSIQELQVSDSIFQNYFQGYEIRFNKQRFQCTLCKIGDQSCYYKKITQFYVNCEKSQNNVGDGTKHNPLNINMFSVINNFDSLVLDEKNYNLALVALNEISLKQLDLELIFSSEISQCQVLGPLKIKSNLLQQIKSLEILHLNITYEQLDNRDFSFLQTSPTLIEGFTNVSISNINVDSYSAYFDQFKIGFQIWSTKLNQIYFDNVKFNRGFYGPQNVLTISISNLLNNLILKNVTFNNLSFNNSQVIQLQYFENIANHNLQIMLDFVNISNITFNSSSFIEIKQNNTILDIKNSQIQFCQLDYSSSFFNYLVFNQQFQYLLSISNFLVKNNKILNYSNILSCNQFNSASFSNISIESNTLYLKPQGQVQNPSLFELNCLQAKSIQVSINTITQYIIINALRQPINFSSSFYFEDIQFNQNAILSNEFVFLRDNNQDPSKGFQTSSFISLTNVNILLVKDIYLINYGELQLLKAIQVNIMKQKTKDQQTSKVLTMQDIQVSNCTANITQQQFSTTPIHINSQVQDTVTINNLYVQDSYLHKTIQADEPPTKIAICAYFEALIGNIELTDSKFLNIFSVQKSNCLVINTKQFTVNNSIFKNDENKYIDFSNTTVRGGFIQSLTQNAFVINTHFEGGRASKGGAIYILFDILGYLNIQNSSFVSNLSFNQFDLENNGGAIFIDSQLCRLQAEIISTSFIQNTAFYKGGALFIQDSQNKKVISIIKSEFIDNFSQFGSVLYFEFQQKQRNIFLLTDSEISYSPINISKSTPNKQIKQHIQQLNFSIQQFFLNGFFEVNLIDNTFIMNQQQNNFIITNFYGIKTYFQISDIQQFTDQNNFYQNIFYQVSLFQMINILYLNIQYSQFNRIYNTSFSDNSCIACKQGMVQLNSYYLNIFNCDFQQNHVYDKGILFIQQTKNQFQLPNSRILQIISDINYLIQLSFLTFKNNYSQKSAGSVYIDSSSTSFINCIFARNIANLGNGGAIYYKGVDQLTNIKVQNTLFDSNQAQIGGAIYSENGQPVQNLYTNNVFKTNIAKQFSLDVFQYPHHMIAIVNGEQLRENIIMHQDGNIKGGISIQFMTEENEYFMEFPVNMTLNIYLNDTQNAYLSNQQISQKSGNFKLNQINLLGVFGQTVQLTFKSDLIKYPIYDNQTGEIISYNYKYNSIDFIVRFFQGCELGYQHLKKQKFDYCQRCSNPFYNNFPGQKCIKCPNYGFCDGGMIYLKEGYWRSDLNSTTFYQCNPELNACTGDIDIYEKKEKIRNPEIRYCKKGFIGPLCSDCDLYGKYWNESYVQDGILGCVKQNQQQCKKNLKQIQKQKVVLKKLSLFGSIYQLSYLIQY
ncbi:hypothetical protein ABPG72_015934 [Tetrahymena utriculariae]